MPTLDVRLTDIPHDLVAEFGASTGDSIVFQNIDRTATAFVREQDTVPDPRVAIAFQVPPGGSYQIQVGPTPLWAWSLSRSGCQLVANVLL